MTDHGDEGDDDPQLGGLRAMWLSMPDEDPPARGLAELMAAARVKAEEMAQPSLWQRIVAMMRRPPVLALATVVVLVAGAVLVGNRKEKFDAPPAADQTNASESAQLKAEPPAAATPEPVPAQAATAPGTGSTVEATGSQDPATLANEQEDSRSRAEERVALEKHANKGAPAPARKAKAEKNGGEELLLDEGRGTVSTDGFVKAEDTRRETKKTAPRPKADASGEKLLIAEPTAPREEPQVRVGGASPPPPPETTAAPAGEALADVEASAGKTKQQAVGAAQLHAQARTAASRNDCAAAKVIAQRIAKQDPAYYRANVTKDAALGKCIGTPAQ